MLSESADMGDGLGNRHVPLQVGKFGGHDAAHRVLRVVEELVDKLPGVRPGGLEHPLHHAGGQLLQQVHCVVHPQLLHNGGQLLVGGRLDQGLLVLRRQVGKHLRRQLLGQGPEDRQHLRPVQLIQQLRQVGGVGLGQCVPQGAHIPALQQLPQRLQGQILFHGSLLLSLKYSEEVTKTGAPRQSVRVSYPAAPRGGTFRIWEQTAGPRPACPAYRENQAAPALSPEGSSQPALVLRPHRST